MFMQIIINKGSQSPNVLLLANFYVKSGSINEIKEAEIENGFDDAEIIIAAMHNLDNVFAGSDWSKDCPYGLDESVGCLMNGAACKEINDVILAESGDLHDRDECCSFRVEVLNINSNNFAAAYLI